MSEISDEKTAYPYMYQAVGSPVKQKMLIDMTAWVYVALTLKSDQSMWVYHVWIISTVNIYSIKFVSYNLNVALRKTFAENFSSSLWFVPQVSVVTCGQVEV